MAQLIILDFNNISNNFIEDDHRYYDDCNLGIYDAVDTDTDDADGDDTGEDDDGGGDDDTDGKNADGYDTDGDDTDGDNADGDDTDSDDTDGDNTDGGSTEDYDGCADNSIDGQTMGPCRTTMLVRVQQQQHQQRLMGRHNFVIVIISIAKPPSSHF